MSKHITFPSSLPSKGEYPEIPMSTKVTALMKTGAWRDSRPVNRGKIAPCQYHCPAGEDIRGYIALTKEGNYDDALALMRESNPLPSICGRVCFHPCERGCNRLELDEAISIHAIERFLSDYGSENGSRKTVAVPPHGMNVAIIGSGPSGLSCGYHLARMGYLVTIYERLPVIGGILRIGIPEYRLPKKILDRDLQYIMECGVEIKTNVGIGRELSFNDLKENCDAVYIGIGAQLDKTLGILGEDAEEVISGLNFLKQLNGRFPCRAGKRVAVIGGGNTAIDCARSAHRLGADVQVVYRRSRNEMPAIESEILEAEQEGIGFIYMASPIRAHLKNGKLSALECIRMKLGDPEESGRRKPIPLEGSNFSLEVDSVIIALGAMLEPSPFTKEIEVTDGLFCITQDGRTQASNVYAGGDCVGQPRTVVHAIGAGRRAAFGIDRELRQNNRGYEALKADVVSFDQINAYYFPIARRVNEIYLPIEERARNFEEANKGFSEQMAVEEANRCFNCGLCTNCSSCLIFCPDLAIFRDGDDHKIDYDYCKGCGVCVEECPRGVLSMEIEKKGDL